MPLQQQILAMMLKAPKRRRRGPWPQCSIPRFAGPTSSDAPALAVYAGTANVPDPAATKELFPNYEATQIAGTGHFLMMEKPEEFNRVLAEFLDKIDF